jgi:hypothetical protein
MSRKNLLTISIVLPLVATSGIASAGSTITDKSYWPNETRSTAYSTAGPTGDWRSALAFDRRTSQFQARPRGSGPIYQGGPKSR